MRTRREIENDINEIEEAILSDLADHDDGDDAGLQSEMVEKLQKYQAELRACGDSENIEGTAEGERCGRDGCDGVIRWQIPKNCSCHINPPCGECESLTLECPKCGWELEEKPE